MQQTSQPPLVPPSDLRLGIGPFENPEAFLESGRRTVQLAAEIASLAPSDSILDVGCGCGRLALPLLKFLSEEGSYTGFDPREDSIAWCNDHIATSDSRFEFIHVDLASDSYNPTGSLFPSTFNFPARRTYDFVILSSVITHLFPEETENYIRNLHDVLAAGGRALVSALMMDEEAYEAVSSNSTIFDFRHKVGETCWTFDPNRPLDGIACDKEWLLETLDQYGLVVNTIHKGTWRQIRSFDIQHDWISVQRACITCSLNGVQLAVRSCAGSVNVAT